MPEQDPQKSRSELLLELDALRHKLAQFGQEKQDLEITLQTITEHSVFVEQTLLEKVNRFSRALQTLKQEKNHLQIALETVTDHSDMFEQELVEARSVLEQEVAHRTRELQQKNHLLQQEVRERQSAEARLRLAASVFEASGEGILITDGNNRIITINQALLDQSGYCAEELLGQTPALLKSGRHDPGFYQNMWATLRASGHWSGEVWNRRKSGEIYSCWLSISVVHDAEGRPGHYIGMYTDNTEKKLSEENLYRLAHYDALTGLPNRALFQDRLLQAMRRAQREQQWGALLLVDLDDFKAVNDSLGHRAGDQLLVLVARRLNAHLPNKEDAVARLGGDEFAVLIDELEPDPACRQAAGMAQKLLDCLQPPFVLDNHEVFSSASIGIACFPLDAQQPEDLLRNADTALYQAKAQGRNSFHFFSQGMNQTAHNRLLLQSHLHRAMERGELLLYYQPQVDLRTGRVSGVEALLRWRHPSLGMISPQAFIPLAEESGLIVPICEWVLHTACTQGRAWQAAGLPLPRIAVNLSARQFRQDQALVEMVDRVLRETRLPACRLELEITESVAMSCASRTAQTLESLKRLGVSLAIDDFGTGYSSLNYLTQFPVDTLKIDASFVANLDNASGKTLVLTIINLAHGLFMEVVAEGVETQEQLGFMQTHRSDYVQGFFFGKPMPAEDLANLLQTPLLARQ